MENWLEINLDSLRNNYKYIKAKSGTKIISVIKADGYGMGSFEIARELERLGTDMFAVAFFKEAEELRKEGIEKEILIFNYISPENLSKCLGKNYILTIYSVEQLKNYILELGEKLKELKFHLKVNTGMNRLGIDFCEIVEIEKLIRQNGIQACGIYSHFADAEGDEGFTEAQCEKLDKYVREFEKLGIKFKEKHMANSTASLKYDRYYFDYVRVGMLLYGLQPVSDYDDNIEGIFIWKARISNTRYVDVGERISYGKKEISEKMKIACIPVGYAHGYMRQLSDKGYVNYKNVRCPVIGKVCMDQMIIDVSGVEDVRIGDEVVLLGEGISAEELADLSGSIADDIICKISSRIERVVIK